MLKNFSGKVFAKKRFFLKVFLFFRAKIFDNHQKMCYSSIAFEY